MTQHPPIIPVILAGGKGERLWPLSRRDSPKQILPLVAKTSLLQDTVARVSDKAYFQPPVVICNETIRFIIAEQLAETPPSCIMIEPIGRNTAPAIAVAALTVIRHDPEAVILVLPSDHAMDDDNAFKKLVAAARPAAESGKLVTFGIEPGFAHTGYGYIQRGKALPKHTNIYSVEAFKEKPDQKTAESYIASGEYYWNSGMFMMKASVYLAELEKFSPEILKFSKLAFDHAQTDLQLLRLDTHYFTECPSDSIDYAVMEKTENAVVMPMSIGWNDLGSWDSVLANGVKDNEGNVRIGDVLPIDCHHSYLRSDGHLLACLGLEDMVVVNTKDATFVSPLNRLQDIKKLTQGLAKEGRNEVIDHTLVFRPWGSYASLVSQPGFQVKRIIVKCGGQLSLQSHYHRSEHWIVVHGTAKVTCGESTFLLHENESTFIPAGVKHRLENPGKIDLELIEVQVGSYLGEDDITRYDDVYGRSS